MSAPPKLKLNFKRQEPADETQTQTPTPAAPPPPQKKLTLKFGGPKPLESPAPEKSKKKRPAKPKIDAGPSKKRRNTDAGSGDDSDAAAPREAVAAPAGPKRIKLLNSAKKQESGVKSIRIRNKARVQARPLGVGYDSEASDMETDPHIEENFILRMVPGEDCEYIKRAINEKRLDRSQIGIKPLTREGRRTILRVRDKQYAATLVDLPTITEGLKSWDKRMFYKAADITQMLLVLGQVQTEQEAMEYPLPRDVSALDDKTYQYAHGITPPLKYVKKRRFRKRVSARSIEQAEKDLANLVAQDEMAIRPPKFELVDATSVSRVEGMVDYEDEYDDEQDAYGEEDYVMQDEDDAQADLFEDELAGELEAALAADLDEAADMVETPVAIAAEQSATPSAGPKPGDESSGDESEESDRDADAEADGEEDEDLDEEALERRREIQEQREIISELEALIAQETAKYEMQTNKILKQKIGKRVQQLKQDVALKKASIGETEANGAA